MSSTIPTAPIDTTSTQSAGDDNIMTEKTSRPPSASIKTAATGADISSNAPAAGHEELNLSATTPNDRPPSANQQPITDTSNELQSASSAVETDLTPNSNHDTIPTESKTSRPPSASLKTNESILNNSVTTSNSRPPSARQRTDESEINSSLPSSTVEKVNNSRPPSATMKTDTLTNHEPTTNSTNFRPTSAAQKTDITILSDTMNTLISANSRPSSANPRTDVSVINDSTVVQTSSRPSSARQRTNESEINGSRPSSATEKINNSTASTSNSRPPSARQESKVNGSRPSSSNQKKNELISVSRPTSATLKTHKLTDDEPTINSTNSRPSSANPGTNLLVAIDTTLPQTSSRQQDETISIPFRSDDLNATQPIIGRPPSAAKNTSIENSTLNPSLPEITPSSEENNPVTSTLRVDSAKKDPENQQQ